MTGKSTRVSKICSLRRGLPSHGRCISLTRGWNFPYFSPTPFQSSLNNQILSKNYHRTLIDYKTAPTFGRTRRHVIVEAMTLYNCTSRFVFNGVVGDNPVGDKLVNFNTNTWKYVSGVGECSVSHKDIVVYS